MGVRVDVSVERLVVTCIVLLGGGVLLAATDWRSEVFVAISGLMGVVVGWWTPARQPDNGYGRGITYPQRDASPTGDGRYS